MEEEVEDELVVVVEEEKNEAAEEEECDGTPLKDLLPPFFLDAALIGG